jgi:two-component sensor histidine kinase
VPTTIGKQIKNATVHTQINQNKMGKCSSTANDFERTEVSGFVVITSITPIVKSRSLVRTVSGNNTDILLRAQAQSSHEARNTLGAALSLVNHQKMTNDDLSLLKALLVETISALNATVDIVKIMRQEYTPSLVECDVTKLVTDVCSSLRPLLNDANIKFMGVRSSYPSITMTTDPYLLKSVLRNLAVNCYKHSHANTVTVLANVDTATNIVTITTCDDGCGFKELPPQKSFGLRLIDSYIGLVGGVVSYSNDPAHGGALSSLILPSPSGHTVTISHEALVQSATPTHVSRPLYIQRPENTKFEQEQHSPLPNSLTDEEEDDPSTRTHIDNLTATLTPRVLVLEDSKIMLQLYKRAFETHNYTPSMVLYCSSPQQCLMAWSRHHRTITHVITDNSFPGHRRNGVDVLQDMQRSHRDTFELVQVHLVSGSSELSTNDIVKSMANINVQIKPVCALSLIEEIVQSE